MLCKLFRDRNGEVHGMFKFEDAGSALCQVVVIVVVLGIHGGDHYSVWVSPDGVLAEYKV